MGSTKFWHKGMYFRIYRRKETLMNTSGWGGAMKDLEELKIYCFGRSMSRRFHPAFGVLILTRCQTRSRTCWPKPRRSTTRTPTKELQSTAPETRSRGATTACGTKWPADLSVPCRR